ncbi:MAG: hypothetical protein ACT4PX_07150 [Actinomycetota bacterium]
MVDAPSAPFGGVRRLATRLFNSEHHTDESAFAWLCDDPVFAVAAAGLSPRVRPGRP